MMKCTKCGSIKTPVQDKGKTRMRCAACKNEAVKRSRAKVLEKLKLFHGISSVFFNYRGFADVDAACSKFLKSRGVYYNKFTDPSRMVLPPTIEYLE